MKQDNTFQVLNTSQTTPGEHWVMISRKATRIFIATPIKTYLDVFKRSSSTRWISFRKCEH